MPLKNEVYLYDLSYTYVKEFHVDFNVVPDYIEYQGDIYILKDDMTYTDPEGIAIFRYYQGLGEKFDDQNEC
jgi:hypothetical protein